MFSSPATAIALEQVLERLGDITLQLHQCNNFNAILETAVQATRDLFGSDRTLVYQFLPTGDGVVLAESVGSGWCSILGQLIYDPCIDRDWIETYYQGRVGAVENVEDCGLASCHVELLTRLQVKANLVAPIVVQSAPNQDRGLWGLLIVHQCSSPRSWNAVHRQMLKQIATQLGIALDHAEVTNLRQTQALASLQGKALNACAEAILITNEKGVVQWANPAFTQLTGYTLDEAIGLNPKELVRSGKQDTTFYAQLWQTITTGQVWRGELINRRKDGSLYHEAMTITPVFNDQGDIAHFIAIKQDVTDRCGLEQYLRDRDEMLQKISEQVPGVIYQYQLYPDGHSCFPYASEGIRDIYEVTPEQVKDNAQPVLDRLHPEDYQRVVERILQSFHNLKIWHDEYRVLLPLQGLRWLEGHSSPERLADGSVLWHGYIRDITERKQTEVLLRQEFQRERMVHLINHHMRESLDLSTILQTVVVEVRQFLETDRVLVYRLNPDWRGLVMAESVATGWLAILDQEITDSYFVETLGDSYHDNHVKLVPDIYTVGFSDCHLAMLERFQVRAKLVVPILQGKHLWGLLIAHHCQGPRDWQKGEGWLLQQLAGQLAIAIQQSELHQQVHALNTSLDQQVQERTAQLQQSLEFEALLKRITDKVRDSLDEQQILHTAVEELTAGLSVEVCDTGIYNPEQTTSTIAYESTHTLSSAQGSIFTIADAPNADVYPQLFQGQVCHFCDLSASPFRPERKRLTVLACPIVDEKTVLGDLWLFKSLGTVFNDLEIRLVQQVANQCAIALRQSRLYQAAQLQVEELERLNHLKDDFLSTVSHELRTPMANIKMATQMLELTLKSFGRLTQPTDPLNRYFKILWEEEEREIDLINDLLDLARLEAGTEPMELTTIDLRSFIPYMAEPFIDRVQEHQQALVLDIPDQLPPLVADAPYLERCLAELLNNACKYTPMGEEIRVSLRATANTLSIAVSNSGIEIPETEHDRIFDKFYRIPNHDPWKHSGTGLGLALVKRMVHQMGGTITVDSGPLPITTFTMQFPC